MSRCASSALVLTGFLILGLTRAFAPAEQDAPSLSARIDELIDLHLANDGIPPRPGRRCRVLSRAEPRSERAVPAVTQLVDFLDDTRRTSAAVGRRAAGRPRERTLVHRALRPFLAATVTGPDPQAAGHGGRSPRGLAAEQVAANTPYDRWSADC